MLLITKDIVTGLKLVHSKGIIHNDIKPENIIIDSNKTPKLVDFGVVCKTNQCSIGDISDITVECCKGFTGTLYYLSPETITNHVRYLSSDVWSLGISLYNSATGGKYPFDYGNKNLRTIFSSIASQNPKLLKVRNTKLNTIVNKALVKDPFNRITLSEIYDILQDM